MFTKLKQLLLFFSLIIILSFNYAGVSNAEEFADGKYFASVENNNGVRWNILVEKSGSSLKVINLNSEAHSVYETKAPFIEMNEKIGTLELDEDLEYDTGWIGYIFDWKFRFYGTLGKFSKVQTRAYSTYIDEGRFKYQPYKFYDSFQTALITNPKLTTKNFEQSVYAQNVDKEAVEDSKSADEAALKMKELELREKELELQLEKMRLEKKAAEERRRIEEEAELEEKLKRESEERKVREEKERKAAEKERKKQEEIAKKKAEEAEKERIKQEEIARIQREQEEEMRKIRARIMWSISDVNDLVSDIEVFLKSHKDEVDILTLVELYKPVKGIKKGSDIQAEDKRSIELLENFLLKNVNFKNVRDEALREREIERLQQVEEERGHLKSALDYALNHIIEHPLDDNIFELTVLYEENVDVDQLESLSEIERVYDKLIAEFEKIGIKEEYINQ